MAEIESQLELETRKLIKYGNDKFGLNETTLRGVLDNASAGGSEDLTTELDTQDTLLNNLEMTINILGSDGETKNVNIVLPEIFKTFDDIYYFIVDNDTIFLSGFKSPTYAGLWKYTISTDTMDQLLTDNYFKTFQIIGNKCLFTRANSYSSRPSSSTFPSLLSYDISIGEITVLINDWSYSNFEFINISDDLWLLKPSSGGRSSYVYDGGSHTIIHTYPTSVNLSTYSIGTYVKDGVLLKSGSSTPVYFLNKNTLELVQIGSGTTYRHVLRANNVILMISYNSSTPLICFDEDTNESHVVNDKFYCSATTTDFYSILDNIIVMGGSSIKSDYTNSFYIFNAVDYSLKIINSEELTTTPIPFLHTKKYCLLNGSGVNGLYLYNFETEEVSKIFNSGIAYKVIAQLKDKYILHGTNQGFVIFNESDFSCVANPNNNFANLTSWSYSLEVDNVLLLSGSTKTCSGIIAFDYDNNAVVELYGDSHTTASSAKGGYGYDIFTPTEDGNYIIESSDKEASPRKLLYNTADKTIRLIGYLIQRGN